MCVNPIKVRNPLYRQYDDNFYYTHKDGELVPHPLTDTIFQQKDFESEFIYVDCRKCYECIGKRQSNYIYRCAVASLGSYSYMFTLTYKDDALMFYQHPKFPSIRFPYPYFRDFQLLIKRWSNEQFLSPRNIQYLVTSEFSPRGRPHFHGIFFVDKMPDDTSFTPYQLESSLFSHLSESWVRNIGSHRNPHYIPLYEFHSRFSYGKLRRNFDLHLITDSLQHPADSVAHYITKYLFKPSSYENKLKYDILHDYGTYVFKEIPRKVWSRGIYSKGLGDSIDLVRSEISESIMYRQGVKSFHSLGNTPRYLVSKYIDELSDVQRKQPFIVDGRFSMPVPEINAAASVRDSSHLDRVRLKLKDYSSQIVDFNL